MTEQTFQDKLQDDLAFDENSLDDAVQKQSGHVAYYGSLMARASLKYNDAKDYMNNTEARISNQLRAEAAQSKVKVTEAQLKNTMLEEADVQEAQKRLNQAKYQLDQAKVAYEAFLGHGHSLNNFIKLYLAEKSGEMRHLDTEEIDRLKSVARTT